MRINHNIAALNTHRQLSSANNANQNSMEKLSSGLRINKAGDDAAGLAISEKMRGQIRGLEQAQSNAQDGISLIQTAEGSMNESHSILQRMRELATQSANDTNTDTDRKELQKEVDQLAQELTRIGNSTEFNTQKLANGGFEGTFQIGANEDQNLSIGINAMDASSLGLAEDVESVSAIVQDTTSGVISADIDASSTFKEGTYTVEFDSTGANASLKDSEGNMLDTVATTDATTAEELTFTVDGNEMSITKDTTDVSGTSVDIKIGASGSNLSETTNDISLAGTQMSTTDALAEGTYTMTYDDTAGAGSELLKLKDGEGNVLANLDGTTLAANTEYTFNLDNGETVSFATDSTYTAPGASVDSEFTVTQSDYTSGTSHAADKDGDGTIDGDAVAVKGIDISSQESANSAITKINDAIETVSSERSKLGAVQNRLDHTINNLGTSSENLTAAESRIRDVDMAKEMMNQTKQSILSQASQAMLAKANQQPQGVLQLLR